MNRLLKSRLFSHLLFLTLLMSFIVIPGDRFSIWNVKTSSPAEVQSVTKHIDGTTTVKLYIAETSLLDKTIGKKIYFGVKPLLMGEGIII